MQYEHRGPELTQQPFGALLGSLISAQTPPTVQPLIVGNPLKGVGEAIGNILPNAINLKNAMTQMPVAQAKAQTELDEQGVAHKRLKGLLDPGLDANGDP